MSPFVAAAAVALQENPAVNAVIDDGHIVYRDYVDISIAVSSPTGLVAPLAENASATPLSGRRPICLLGPPEGLGLAHAPRKRADRSRAEACHGLGRSAPKTTPP